MRAVDSLLALVLLGGIGALPRYAMAQDYRQLEFVDGRIWSVVLTQSDADGMSVELPQGKAWVGYEDVLNVTPISADDYGSAKPWNVKVLAVEAGGKEELEGPAREVYDGLLQDLRAWQGIDVQAVRPRVKRGAPGEVLDDCGITSTVSVGGEADRGTDYVVAGHLRQGAELTVNLTLCSIHTGGEQRMARTVLSVQPNGSGLENALAGLMGMTPPEQSPPPTQTGTVPGEIETPKTSLPDEPTVTEVAEEPAFEDSPVSSELETGETVESIDLRRLAFVPLPGFPSLYVRDIPRFGRTWLAVIPMTTLAAAWINRSPPGSQSVAFRPSQRVFLTAAAYYVITVGANQYMAQESGILVGDDTPGLH